MTKITVKRQEVSQSHVDCGIKSLNKKESIGDKIRDTIKPFQKENIPFQDNSLSKDFYDDCTKPENFLNETK